MCSLLGELHDYGKYRIPMICKNCGHGKMFHRAGWTGCCFLGEDSVCKCPGFEPKVQGRE